MNWTAIDQQSDLDELDASNYWEDSEVVEYYALVPDEKYFPDDVSRSGWTNKNIHILINADSSRGSHLEIVLIDCDHFDSHYLENIHFHGRVDVLKRVEVTNHDGAIRMRCSRKIYKWLNLEEPGGQSYFRHSESVS